MNKDLGRLIYFLNPDKINLELIENIFKKEFEIYPVYSPDKLIKLLKEFPSSVIFINIDNAQFEWKNYIQNITENETLSEISINIICRDLKSVENINTLKIDNVFQINVNNDNLDLIVKYLEDNFAKGKRRYIRVELEDRNKIEFRIKIDNKIYNGFIININSTAGVFNFDDKSFHIKSGTEINDIKLKIDEYSFSLSGKVLKDMESFNENLCVILFNINKMKKEDITVIQSYIFKTLQIKMIKIIENI